MFSYIYNNVYLKRWQRYKRDVSRWNRTLYLWTVKQSELITYQPKTFENPDIADIKSVITEHQRALHNLSKTIKHAEKVGSNSSLYNDTKKVKNFWMKKMWK